MMPSYSVRLLLLSCATFFIVQWLVAALVALIAPAAIRRAQTMRPHRAARFLLTLRLLPAGFSIFAVAALCVPSYLRFEPRIAGEEVGIACLVAAIFGALIGAIAICKTVAAQIRSSSYQRGGFKSNIEGETVWIVRHSAGLALAGIARPRLLISECALTGLSGDQLAVALRHEHAHRASRDNLKRLLILLAPAIFPRLQILDREWAKYAEWAADDRAVKGDAGRSIALATALVQVARLQSGIAMPLLVTSLVEADEDLSQRVDRLLHSAPVSQPSPRYELMALSFAASLIVAFALNLRLVHRLLEHIYDLW
jgi:beta-lactamase regulating signal transducer with metallopeptidase domain